MIPISGFAPDADQFTLGILTDCQNMIPANDCMEGAPAPTPIVGVPALTDPCQGIAVLYKLDGTYRVVAGTADALYELSGGSWSDVSDTGGYSGGSDSLWMFTQFGDASLATNKLEGIQRSTSGAFAVISGAPKAEIIFTVGDFVMALNVDDGSVKLDGWHCCAALDDTDWTESIATQCASGRLVSNAGRITAGARIGPHAVAFKERAIYLGQYSGPPAVWQWQQVYGSDAGCVGRRAVCDIGNALFFVSHDGFWLFDGNQAVPVGDEIIRRYFLFSLNVDMSFITKVSYDRSRGLVWIFYPSSGSDVCDKSIVYHVKTGKFGKVDVETQECVYYVSPLLTYDDLGDLAATYDDFPDISYDSPIWISGAKTFSIVNSSNQVVSLEGNSTSSSLTTWCAGDDSAVSLLQQIRARFLLPPTSASVQTFHSMDSGGTMSSGSSGEMNDGKFDTLYAARWHKARIDFMGPVRVSALDAVMKKSGMR